MLELEKQNLRRNRLKSQTGTQVTLDDDFIVPDTMSDMAEVILDSGIIQLEPVKVQRERITVRGKLDFHVLYRKEEGGLQALGGSIPFEEAINVPDLDEKDYVSVSWQLEDLNTEMIHSRKLGIKAIVTLEAKAESLYDTEAAVDVRGADDEIHLQVRRERIPAAAIALRRKDTYRLKQDITLPGSKPVIERMLWTEMKLAGCQAKPLDGQIHLEGTLMVFALYEGGESGMVQWVEESIPFSGEVEMQGATADMIPVIGLKLIHRDLEEKPDYDGEMRELSVDAVIELDVRLYEEQELELLQDLYATNREIVLDTGEAVFDRILTRNFGKCRVHGKLPHLPVVIRLFLQITVNQLQADDRYHIRSGTLHLHFTGKRNAFLHPLDHTALPALIEGKYHQGSLQMDLTVQRLCEAAGQTHFSPQHTFNSRFTAGRRNVLLLIGRVSFLRRAIAAVGIRSRLTWR